MPAFTFIDTGLIKSYSLLRLFLFLKIPRASPSFYLWLSLLVTTLAVGELGPRSCRTPNTPSWGVFVSLGVSRAPRPCKQGARIQFHRPGKSMSQATWAEVCPPPKHAEARAPLCPTGTPVLADGTRSDEVLLERGCPCPRGTGDLMEDGHAGAPGEATGR